MCSGDSCGPTRRELLAGGALVAAGVSSWPALAAGPAVAPTRILDDASGIQHGFVAAQHPGGGTLRAYASRPTNGTNLPGVVVATGSSIDEEYIRNTCVALSLAGFAAIAPGPVSSWLGESRT